MEISMKRNHVMPFGAQFTSEGKVRFRLWAPAASQIKLLLDNEEPIPMSNLGGGWYEWISETARAGSLYQYQIDDGIAVPDPASRYNPNDVHGESQVISAADFDWQDSAWHNRPWQEAVIYEIHVGTFTPQGTFAGIEQKLGYLSELGVTAIELMPIADFPGSRNWGYDGVLLFAPESVYGTPNDLKHLIQSAHHYGIMVLLDVVYNHFGPEGNYLNSYAPQFFTARHHTPWGAAINFDSDDNRIVRDFYIHNALYWLEEYHFDGLRLDAVHAIIDDHKPHILEELAQTVREKIGIERHIHLILENDCNTAGYLTRGQNKQILHYNAQWNDDIHHAYHALLTKESDGYYADYADKPIHHLGRCLVEGFAYQGEVSFYRQGISRGEPSTDLPPSAFVNFLQNHDQIGNRALGERLINLAAPEALRAATALFLLSPSIPLLFMGEEWGAPEPFLYFCGFEGELAKAVTAGRRSEFAHFEGFHDLNARESIPDPCELPTFDLVRLDWQKQESGPHQGWLILYRELLALRQQIIVPNLDLIHGGSYQALTSHALRVNWQIGADSQLLAYTNLGAESVNLNTVPSGRMFYGSIKDLNQELSLGKLPAFSTAWYLLKVNNG